MPDIGVGSILSAGASIVGGMMAGDAASSAAQTQAQGGQAAIAEQQREFDIGQQALKPYRDIGQAGVYKLADYLGLSMPPAGGGGFGGAVGGYGAAGGGAAGPMPSAAQFTTGGTPGVYSEGGEGGTTGLMTPGTPGTFDAAGYQAALAKWQQANAQPAAGGNYQATGAAPTPALVQALYQQYLGRAATPDEVKQQLAAPWGTDLRAMESAIAQATGKPATYQVSGSVPGPNTGSLLKPFSFDISQDPGYQFRLGEGTKAIENSAAARGSQLSGATLKELLRYGSDYASGEFNTAFQRDQATKNQIYSMLAGTAGMGQGATTTGVQAGQNAATNIGNTMTGIANAQAAGQVGQANAITGAMGNAASGINQAMLLKSIFNPNPGVASVNSGINFGTAGAGDLNFGIG